MILAYNRDIQMQTNAGAFNTYARSNRCKNGLQMANLSIPRTSGIYKITCTANNRIYIGSAVNLHKRWCQHRIDLRGQYHCNSFLQRAWNKYGESEFTFEILELVTSAILLNREQYWLDLLKFYDRSIGFNIATDAIAPSRGRKVSDETRAKQSASHKGRKRTPAEIANFIITMTGHKTSPETCAKMSAAGKGRKPSPESIAKSAASRTGLKRSFEANVKTGIANSKCYIVIDPSGNEFEVFNLSKFCRENNLTPCSLHGVVCGHRNHFKGWKARLLE